MVDLNDVAVGRPRQVLGFSLKVNFVRVPLGLRHKWPAAEYFYRYTAVGSIGSHKHFTKVAIADLGANFQI